MTDPRVTDMHSTLPHSASMAAGSCPLRTPGHPPVLFLPLPVLAEGVPSQAASRLLLDFWGCGDVSGCISRTGL